jgi:hypothetical protein
MANIVYISNNNSSITNRNLKCELCDNIATRYVQNYVRSNYLSINNGFTSRNFCQSCIEQGIDNIKRENQNHRFNEKILDY